MKKVKRFNPFTIDEFEYMESWLEDMAKKGLLLKKVNGFVATFERGEARNRRYRQISTASGLMETEEEDFYKDSGWQMVNSGMGWNLFYTDDENAEELFSDPSSFRLRMKRFLRFSLFATVAYIFMIYAMSKNLSVILSSRTILHYFDEMGLIAGVLAPLLFVMAIVFFCKLALGMLHQFYRMKRKKDIRHNIPYKRRKRVNQVLSYGVAVLFLFFFLSIAIVGGRENVTLTKEKALAYEGTHPVMFKEMDKENWVPFEKAMETGTWARGLDYSIEQYSSSVFSQGVDLDAWRNWPSGEYARYYARFLVARSEEIAQRYVNEEVGMLKKGFVSKNIELAYPGVDYMGYYYNKDDDDQHLILRKGKKIEIAMYHGEKNLMDYVPLFVENINK